MYQKKIPIGLEQLEKTGPFSTAVQTDHRINFSGILPELKDFRPASPNIADQVFSIMVKIGQLLHQCHRTLDDIYEVTIMIQAASQEEFNERYRQVNIAYTEWLGAEQPAIKIMPVRKAFGVSFLPFGALVEIQPRILIQEEWEERTTH